MRDGHDGNPLISRDLKPGVAVGEATDFITKTAASVVPPTLRASLQGEALTFQNTVRDLTLLMALAVFVMYVILAILYESYVHPLTVLRRCRPRSWAGWPRCTYSGKPRASTPSSACSCSWGSSRRTAS